MYIHHAQFYNIVKFTTYQLWLKPDGKSTVAFWMSPRYNVCTKLNKKTQTPTSKDVNKENDRSK